MDHRRGDVGAAVADEAIRPRGKERVAQDFPAASRAIPGCRMNPDVAAGSLDIGEDEALAVTSLKFGDGTGVVREQEDFPVRLGVYMVERLLVDLRQRPLLLILIRPAPVHRDVRRAREMLRMEFLDLIENPLLRAKVF